MPDNLNARRIKDKEDYTNRELFLTNPSYLDILK